MKREKIDCYIIPSSDSHQSEYVADYFKGREFISGFTGSAGTLLVGRIRLIFGLMGDTLFKLQ